MYGSIVVGAGSGGWVWASRTSALPSMRVRLSASGPADDTPLLQLPATREAA
jgi:hypothetical protein